MKRKFLLLLAVIFFAGVGCTNSVPVDVTTEHEDVVLSDAKSVEIDSWSGSFSNDEFSFLYPADIVTVSEDSAEVFVKHEILHEYTSPCGEGSGLQEQEILKTLQDIDMRFSISNANLEKTLQNEEKTYVLEQFFQDSTLVLEPGFISPFSVEGYDGFQVTSGSHGCGMHEYYVPLDEERTLVMKRSFGELTAASTISQELKKVPGVILPEEGEAMFQGIVESFRLRK